jgi:hypothetical protein
VYVRDRRNRDRDDRRLWGDLRRSRPSRKEESEWTMIGPATSTLNFGEVDSLFTEVSRETVWKIAGGFYVDLLCLMLQESEIGHFGPVLATRYTPNRGLSGLSRQSLE